MQCHFKGYKVEEPKLEKPYVTLYVEYENLYNSNYGDHRICECGHEYIKHFEDPHKAGNIGHASCCSVCGNCVEFQEQTS